MTAILLALAVFLAFPFGFWSSAGSPSDAPASTECAKEPASVPAAPSDAFADTVRPVLSARCAPCHEPGGKMYATMPFDRGETIASHREGILKRLKGEDRAAVEKWLASLPPAN